MANILFIENRFRTIFWEIMARKLQDEGHFIFWIVQNKSFKPSFGESYVIPYPQNKKIGSIISKKDEEIGISDRNINYFRKSSISHYSYYREYIKNILDKIKVDMVFGESTLFHELITIDICKNRRIPYMNPSTTRFPPGRFSFYKYDTLIPFAGSNELMENKEALDLIRMIKKREVSPDYMKKRNTNFTKKVKRIIDLLRLSNEYIRGERFNTPHPYVKFQIEKKKKENIKEWDILANENNNKVLPIKILYPLQLQPEANLDVWGSSHRNQLKLIKELSEIIPEDTCLYIKPNPKSKYEISEELIKFVAKQKNIIPLPHSAKMEEILPDVDIVITVTGTIAIECILSDKPIITLVKTINNKIQSCIYVENIKDTLIYLELVKSKKYPSSNDTEKIEYINEINATSYRGITSQSYINNENINNCFEAFKSVVNNISRW